MKRHWTHDDLHDAVFSALDAGAYPEIVRRLVEEAITVYEEELELEAEEPKDA